MKFATSCSTSFACIIAALSLTTHSVNGMNERREAGRNNFKKERKQRLGSSLSKRTSSSSFLSLLEEAGKPVQKIIGGEEAPTDGSNLYPWFTQMMRINFFSGNWEWGGCGGFLVAPEYVLTAAHCVGGFNGVLVGALCPNEGNNCGQPLGPIQLLDQIFVHPDYNPYDNDFALVKLQTRSEITPVDMDDGTESYVEGEKLWAMGFGNLNTTFDEFPDVLHHVEVSYVTNEVCSDSYDAVYGDNSVTDNMMCAADPGQDSCQGDSGGPLYDKVNEKVVGVVSWGLDCALPGYPGVYSRISSQIYWIRETICMTGGHSDPAPEFCEFSLPPSESPSSSPIRFSSNKRCIPNNSEHYEDFVHGSWKKIDLAPGTKCCIDPDDYGSIIQQHVAMECPCLPFTVNIEPDNYPEETSWMLTNLCTDKEVAAENIRGPAEYDYEECLPPGAYEFTIRDSFGDGICCSYGTGSYVVTYGGDEVASGGDFGSFETTPFREGFCDESVTPVEQRCIPDNTTHFEEFVYGNWIPRKLASGTKCCPAVTGTFDFNIIQVNEETEDCPCKPFELTIVPDYFPGETSWFVGEACTGNLVDYDDFNSTNIAYGDTYTKELCLPTNTEYVFEINDSYGDGICCSYGEGSYTVAFGDEVVMTGGTFVFSDRARFGGAGENCSWLTSA